MIRFYLFKIFSVLFFLIELSASVNRNENVVIETDIGSIRGLRAEDGNYTMFMGIPYATVNKTNVFGDSIPQAPFEDKFNAYDDSAICPQVEEFNFTIVGSLDCLHLNIYVPDTANNLNPLPVMVYIYGGGFSIGFAGRFLYGPKYLVRHDIILVTLNYRLGPYGFMCLDTPEVPGNAGLKDQVLALRWIQNHIGSFGGDPEKVTLFGNSAGGMSNMLHLVSETEKLFTNIITQSGSAFNPSFASPGNYEAPLQIAAALNYTTNDVNEAIYFLSNADVHSLIEVSAGLNFQPCIEKEFPGVEMFLRELPINSKHSKAGGVTILLGYNSHEMLTVLPGEETPEIWAFMQYIFEISLGNAFNFEETKNNQLSNILRRFYIGDKEVNAETRQQLIDFMSDFAFVYPLIRSVEPLIEADAEKVYQYLFSHEGNRNFIKIKDNITLPGVTHADEIGYLFDMIFIPNEPTVDDQLIIDRMTTMWTNFAKYRDPTPGTNSLLPVRWEPITKGSPYHYIDINVDMTANMRYEPQRMSFWDLFYKSYRENERGFIDESERVPDSSTAAGFSPFLALAILINVLGIRDS